MNSWQCLKQLQYLLRTRVWTGSSNVVFQEGSVVISAGPEVSTFGSSIIFPAAVIRPMDSSSDPEHDEEPDLIMQRVGIKLIVRVSGDPIGQNVLMGGNRTGTNVQSLGRGLLEMEEEMLGAVEALASDSGIIILNRLKGAAEATADGSLNYISSRDYNFDLLTTRNRFYHTALNLTATALGGGNVSLTWSLPPNRFDRFRVILRRAAGSTPPATATSGTGVMLSGNLATSVTDSPGVGPFAYALFASYDETHNPSAAPSSDERYSASVTKTVTAT